MRTDLVINTIIEWPGTENSERFIGRVLWLDPKQNQIVLIDLDKKQVMPEIHNYQQFLMILNWGC